MELDITGKVGIENALELLEEEVSQLKEMCESVEAISPKTQQMDAYIKALEHAIEIVKLNLPVIKKD